VQQLATLPKGHQFDHVMTQFHICMSQVHWAALCFVVVMKQQIHMTDKQLQILIKTGI
jgi:hypothetical protein